MLAKEKRPFISYSTVLAGWENEIYIMESLNRPRASSLS